MDRLCCVMVVLKRFLRYVEKSCVRMEGDVLEVGVLFADSFSHLFYLCLILQESRTGLSRT